MLGQGDSKDARRVPPPSEDKLPDDAPSYALSARDFWLTPEETANIGCISCHDSDAYIHTPYVDQVKLPNGQPMVPSNPFGLYKVVGRKYFTDWLSEFERSYAIDTINGGKCTSCHRLGSRQTCDNFLPQSIGERFAADTTAFARTEFALTNWMPPPASGVTTREHWESNAGGFKAHAEKLMECCSNPNAAGCTRSPINLPPPPL